ncbi:hypothetical protein C5167_012068 [Papaver somniferum]|uniref:Uncharacterized protein n=1 Tax=Papaver somniferum TaxID=3469 RepID=A0A4Y7IZM7_PAPSO|nr:hypothetical protein C5167_012068 [Papaver somniferum]
MNESHQCSIDASVDSLSGSSSSSQFASTSLSSLSPPSQHPSISTSQGGKVPCPFKGYDGCGGGVCGRGYAKSVVYHISISPQRRIKKPAEHVYRLILIALLLGKRSYLTCRCGLFNGHGAEFLIYGVLKPWAGGVSDNAVESRSSCDSSGLNDAVVGLSLDMLHAAFQRRITTIISIPPPCRLQFSRVLKSALDKVIGKPGDLQAWLQLLLLPTCTLNPFVPNCSTEERSDTLRNCKLLQSISP